MGVSKRRLFVLIQIFFDLMIIHLGFLFAFYVRFDLTSPQTNMEPYLSLSPWITLIAWTVFFMFDLYTDWRRKNLSHLLYSTTLSVVCVSIVIMALTFWMRGFSFPRSVFLLAFLIQLVLLSLSRWLLWLFDRQLHGRKKVLIVGNDLNDGLSLAEKFLNHSKGWFVVYDFLPINELAKLEDILSSVDVILVSSFVQDKEKIITVCQYHEKEVLVVPDLYEICLSKSSTQQIDDMLVLSIHPPKLTVSQMLIKRMFDILVSSLLLILTIPLMILLTLLIPLTSTGPALYKQERLGKGGKPFQLYKFRSMVQDAEKKTGPVLASEKDPRITPIGKLIRSTRLDELPQLFNVLKGDMSLIGPRPERAYFIEQFKNNIPHYTFRLSVKPGLTGLAQVLSNYSTSVEDKLRFDLMYVYNYSLTLDIKILFQTIRVVLQREQANGVKQDPQSKDKLMHLFNHFEVASTKESLQK
jgi:exopolysaccharide biosynthesis polyprenyl glycosylphosphotransferase